MSSSLSPVCLTTCRSEQVLVIEANPIFLANNHNIWPRIILENYRIPEHGNHILSSTFIDRGERVNFDVTWFNGVVFRPRLFYTHATLSFVCSALERHFRDVTFDRTLITDRVVESTFCTWMYAAITVTLYTCDGELVATFQRFRFGMFFFLDNETFYTESWECFVVFFSVFKPEETFACFELCDDVLE